VQEGKQGGRQAGPGNSSVASNGDGDGGGDGDGDGDGGRGGDEKGEVNLNVAHPAQTMIQTQSSSASSKGQVLRSSIDKCALSSTLTSGPTAQEAIHVA
jgi:hypothetical protein